MFKAMFSVPVVVLMLLVCGCGSTQVPEDTTAPVVEPAADDPSGSLNAGAGDGFSALGGGAGQGAWVAPEQLAGNADADRRTGDTDAHPVAELRFSRGGAGCI